MQLRHFPNGINSARMGMQMKHPGKGGNYSTSELTEK